MEREPNMDRQLNLPVAEEILNNLDNLPHNKRAQYILGLAAFKYPQLLQFRSGIINDDEHLCLFTLIAHAGLHDDDVADILIQLLNSNLKIDPTVFRAIIGFMKPAIFAKKVMPILSKSDLFSKLGGNAAEIIALQWRLHEGIKARS